jgi:hypothetical protein
MYITISGKTGSGKSTTAEALRKFWGERGVATFRYDMQEPAQAMAKATMTVGRHYGLGDGVPRSLVCSIYDWGRLEDPEMWVKAAKFRIEQITKVWEDKKLLYVVVIDGPRYKREFDAWPQALKVRVEAPHAVLQERVPLYRIERYRSETSIEYESFDLSFDTSKKTTEEIVEELQTHIRGRFNG